MHNCLLNSLIFFSHNKLISVLFLLQQLQPLLVNLKRKKTSLNDYGVDPHNQRKNGEE